MSSSHILQKRTWDGKKWIEINFVRIQEYDTYGLRIWLYDHYGQASGDTWWETHTGVIIRKDIYIHWALSAE